MKAQQVRTVIIALDDLVDVHARLADLVNGKALTALETGVADETPILDLEWVGLQVLFDGFKYTLFLNVTTA